MRKLTKRERFFVAEYPKDWNGTEAVIRSKYKVKNRQRASEIAYQLLQKTPVVEAINRAVKERLQRIGVHTERVLTELARVGLSDIRSLYDEDGRLKHPKDWDPETAAAVAGVEVTEEFEGKGEDKKHVGTTKKVRVFDKVRALESLGKHLGLFPSDKKADDEGGPKEFNITNLELSAKLVLLVTLMTQRQKALEEEQSKPLPNKL
jgi:phage terminase small subunit